MCECVRESEKESKQTFPIGRTQFCSGEILIPFFQSNSSDKNRKFNTWVLYHVLKVGAEVVAQQQTETSWVQILP